MIFFSPGLSPWSCLPHHQSLSTSLMTVNTYMLTAPQFISPTWTSLSSPDLNFICLHITICVIFIDGNSNLSVAQPKPGYHPWLFSFKLHFHLVRKFSWLNLQNISRTNYISTLHINISSVTLAPPTFHCDYCWKFLNQSSFFYHCISRLLLSKSNQLFSYKMNKGF